MVECAPAEQRYFGTSVLRYRLFGRGFPFGRRTGVPTNRGTHERSGAINEKPIKVDAETDRLVSELAYFLGSTKKAIVREAVADFAAARGRGRSADSDRRHVADDTGATGDAREARAVLPLHQRFDQLPLIERLSLRRSELIRAFADHGASNIRVLGPLAFGRHADEFELLAETDPIRGGEAAAELQMIAARLLCAPSTVVSSTALRLFNPDRLRRALEESRPL